MDEIEFWAIIDEARQGADDDLDVIIGNLIELLDDLDDEELIGFHHQMIRRYCECYRWDIRAAVVVMCGEDTSEETIDGFIAWLIAGGQERFESVLTDPDTLADADFLAEDALNSDILGLANQQYQARTGGKEIPDETDFAPPETPGGKKLGPADLPKKFPKLCKAFEY